MHHHMVDGRNPRKEKEDGNYYNVFLFKVSGRISGFLETLNHLKYHILWESGIYRCFSRSLASTVGQNPAKKD